MQMLEGPRARCNPNPPITTPDPELLAMAEGARRALIAAGGAL
jgi:hypothetical protein